METQLIKDTLENICQKARIGKKMITIIDENTKKLKNLTEEQQNIINNIIKLLKIGSVKKDVLEQLQLHTKSFTDKICSNNNALVNILPEFNEVEMYELVKTIDNEVGYVFSDNKPMNGIKYDAKNSRYRSKINGKSVYFQKLEEICDLKKKEILTQKRHSMSEIGQKFLSAIKYQNKSIITFWTQHEDKIIPLFDILHILKLIDVSERQEERIRKQLNDMHMYCYFEKNEFGGYIYRELINEDTMYKIVFDSRSEFSKSFKDDITKLLIALRESGQIQFTNTMPLVRNRRQSFSDVDTRNAYIDFRTDIQQPIGMKLTNTSNIIFIKNMIRKGEQIRLQKYVKSHVMYFFITNIRHPDDLVVCKIGYTADIVERINSLSKEYAGSYFLLIGIKGIKNEQREKEFHDLIKSRYSQLVYNDIKIGRTQKTELYIFEKCLYEEFSYIKDKCDKKDVVDDIYLDSFLEGQHNVFSQELCKSTIELYVSICRGLSDYDKDMVKHIYDTSMKQLDKDSRRYHKVDLERIHSQNEKIKLRIELEKVKRLEKL